jgi:hypothetical protein
LQFRCRGSRRESAVAQLWSLGGVAKPTVEPNIMKNLIMKLGIPDTLPPLSFRELMGYLWFGVIGLLLLTLGIFPHSVAVRWLVVFLLVCWLVVPARGYFRRSASDMQAEGRKAMSAQIRLYTFVVVAFSIGFAFWARHLGLAWPVIIGALFAIDAFANMIASLTEWWRLSMFGHSLGLMACGFAFPFVDKGKWAILLGGTVLVGSMSAAAILYYQVRHHETFSIAHDNDAKYPQHL